MTVQQHVETTEYTVDDSPTTRGDYGVHSRHSPTTPGDYGVHSR